MSWPYQLFKYLEEQQGQEKINNFKSRVIKKGNDQFISCCDWLIWVQTDT